MNIYQAVSKAELDSWWTGLVVYLERALDGGLC